MHLYYLGSLPSRERGLKFVGLARMGDDIDRRSLHGSVD